jgi:DNA repair exonuclease SbcCD ATPase subunit
MQLPLGQRRQVIEDLLDLQIFTTMNTLLKDDIIKNNEKISEINNNKKIIEEKIKITKKHLEDAKIDIDSIIEEKTSYIEKVNKDIDVLQTNYSDLNDEIDNMSNGLEDDTTLSKKINTLTKLKHQIEVKLNNLQNEIVFLNNHDNCPTCKQSIDNNFKCESIETKKSQIEEIQVGLNTLSEQYVDLDTKIKYIMSIKQKINEQRMNLNVMRTKINGMISQRKILENDIASISNKKESIQYNDIQKYEYDLSELETQYEECLQEKATLSAAASLLKDGGIKSKIVKQYIPIINKLINKYLSIMDFYVQFELNEEFNETIKSRYRDEFSYASFSEGEKMRINLSILFTWRAVAKQRNSISTNILIMDEVFDSSLDANGTEEFLKLMNNLKSDNNVFIISHKTDQISDKFENVLKFKKVKNFSRIE